jgi:hypothetical protein
VKRLRRIIFNWLTVVSLLLCVMTIFFWMRSYWISDCLGANRKWHSILFETGGGQFLFQHTSPIHGCGYEHVIGVFHSMDRSDGALELGKRMPGDTQHFRKWGFWIVTGERWGEEHQALFVPAWFAFAACVVLPLAWWREKATAGRPTCVDGTCRFCGYDLRATPDRCPECGTTPLARISLQN